MQTCEDTTDCKDLWFLNSHVRVALSKRDNDEGISLLEHHLPFGDSPPLHVHHDEDELFYLMEGEMVFKVGDDIITARAGDAVVAPRGRPHGFRVVSPGGVRVLTISRGGFEAAVRAASRPAQGPGLPDPVEPTPAMQAALGTVCAANGITLLGPPIAA